MKKIIIFILVIIIALLLVGYVLISKMSSQKITMQQENPLTSPGQATPSLPNPPPTASQKTSLNTNDNLDQALQDLDALPQ